MTKAPELGSVPISQQLLTDVMVSLPERERGLSKPVLDELKRRGCLLSRSRLFALKKQWNIDQTVAAVAAARSNLAMARALVDPDIQKLNGVVAEINKGADVLMTMLNRIEEAAARLKIADFEIGTFEQYEKFVNLSTKLLDALVLAHDRLLGIKDRAGKGPAKETGPVIEVQASRGAGLIRPEDVTAAFAGKPN